MGDWDDLLSKIREHTALLKEKRKRPGGALAYRVMHESHTDEEWLALEKEVQAFLKTASREDIEDFGDCGECLIMICSGIRLKMAKKNGD